jgi:hypothetical protein
MDYRRWCWWAEWALVAAVVGLHAVIFLWPENPARPNFVVTAAHDAQLLSAIVLIIGWGVLGPGRLWIRLAAAPILVGLWFLPWNSAMQPREANDSFVASVFLFSAVLIGGLRAVGARIVKRSAASGPERGAQFSLLGLLLATTAIAGGIGVLEALRPTLGGLSRSQFVDMSDLILFSPPSVRVAQQARLLVLSASVVLAALGGLWVTLRPGASWLRLAALVGLVPAIGVYLTHLSGAGNAAFAASAGSLACGLAMVAGLTSLSVLPLRLLGFRLQRSTPLAVEAVASQPARRQWIERMAAIFLLAVAVAAVPLTRELLRRNAIQDFGRINGGSMEWEPLLPAGPMQTPMQAFAEWIDPGVIWGRNLSIVIGSGQYVHPQLVVKGLDPAVDFVAPVDANSADKANEEKPK